MPGREQPPILTRPLARVARWQYIQQLNVDSPIKAFMPGVTSCQRTAQLRFSPVARSMMWYRVRAWVACEIWRPGAWLVILAQRHQTAS